MIKSANLLIIILFSLYSQTVFSQLIASKLSSIQLIDISPTDTAISDKGDIYILDGVGGQVLVYSKQEIAMFKFSKTGHANGELYLPMSISISHNKVYIADTGNARISIFSLKGKFERNIDLTTAQINNSIVSPVSLHISANKILWSDRSNHQICSIKIDTDKVFGCFGSKGSGLAKFNYPYKIISDNEDYIYIVDVLNARIQQYSSADKHVMNIGYFAVNQVGSLYRPNGLAIYKNILMVSDSYFGNIQLYKNSKSLGRLVDLNDNEIILSSANNITIYNNILFVTDTQNNSIEIYSLSFTSIKSHKKKSKQSIKSMADNNCISCHISWSENTTLQDTTQSIIPAVANQKMCMSCHHGVVIDSRINMGKKFQHPDIQHVRRNKPDSHESQVKIEKDVPVIIDINTQKPRIYCGSCHTPHSASKAISEGNIPQHNNWMRYDNSESKLCFKCHASKINHVSKKTHTDKKTNHVIGVYLSQPNNKSFNKDLYPKNQHLRKGLPSELKKNGSKLNKSNQIICQTCHLVHGSNEEKLSVINFNDASLCITCHQRHNAENLAQARKKGVHPVNIKLENPVKINSIEITEINCLTCHRAHNADSDKNLLVMDNENGELCSLCHKEYNKVVYTDHDLRYSENKIKSEKNKIKDVCSSCHKLHAAEKNSLMLLVSRKDSYQGDIKISARDKLCMDCHHSEGLAKKTVVEAFTHPSKNLILRSDPTKMPLVDSSNKINEFANIACISCHDAHRWNLDSSKKSKIMDQSNSMINISGDINNSFLRHKNIKDSFCKDCHGIETLLKYKYYHLKFSRN